MPNHPTTAIAIPARDEQDHIAACLEALAAQTVPPDHVVLCINNTTDATAAVAAAVTLPPQTRIHLLVRELPPSDAHVGTARRVAMDAAAALAGPGGVLLTTDADGAADPDWIEANLAALEAGADVVCGWVDLDPESWAAIPMVLHEDEARVCAYDALCDEIHARLDPDPADPLPRHTQSSGASIALWSRWYRAVGGLPRVRAGEDRALVAALRRADAAIRHDPAVHVTVSGRVDGRAPGGMADTIRRRLAAPDLFVDDRLEPAADCARRARLRATLRRAAADSSLLPGLAAELGCPVPDLAAPFGVIWSRLEETSSTLVHRRLAVADLPEQTRQARRLVNALRAEAVTDATLAAAD